MLRSKAFVKVTNKGSVVKVVKEHYLRDDIGCGILGCQICTASAAEPGIEGVQSVKMDPFSADFSDHTKFSAPHILVPDTNIFLHHLDVVDQGRFHDVVVLQTVLNEVRHQNTAVYNRLRNLIGKSERRFYVFSNEHHRETFIEKLPEESPNDYNDRAIRMAAKWYANHVVCNMNDLNVILITNDVANQKKASESDISAFSLFEYVSSLRNSGTLLDMIESSRDVVKDSDFSGYDEHISEPCVAAGLKTGELYQGSLFVSHYDCFEGTVSVEIGGESVQYHIKGRMNMNRAMTGDVVVIKPLTLDESMQASKIVTGDDEMQENGVLLPAVEEAPIPMEQQSRRAKVVAIAKRKARALCGSVDKKSVAPNSMSSQSVLFVAMDRRIPKVRLRTRQAQQLVTQRILIAIDGWDKSSKYPSGHLIRQLGLLGDRATETEAILLEHEVSYAEFTPQILACLPSPDWKPTAEDYQTRADFRSLDVCSIDPPGCTDIDDALHARPLPNGNIEVGVHIADVTHFVKADSAMDKEASSRGTTVYLVDRRIDMLPSLLGTNLCSLRCDVERLAFSCIWEMTRNAQVVNVRFTKSIIQSKASFTYDQAQARLDGKEGKPDEPLVKNLFLLNSLAKQLRQRRIEAGALTLASPEVRFNLDTDTQNPVDVELKEMKEANALVEEFMLLANIYVATELYKNFPESAPLRRHPSPPTDNFEALNMALTPWGFNLNTETSKELADSLDNAVIKEDPYFNTLLRIMTTRCMLQAVYFASGTLPYDQYWHYGLATPIYTHFTSPIRRYADVLVHRLLAACIDVRNISPGIVDPQRLEETCHNLNYRHRMAQQAQRSSVALFTHLFFKGKTALEDAYVIKVMEKGFVALITKYGIEGMITFGETEERSGIIFSEETMSFTLNGSPFISIFQKITVELSVEEIECSQRQKLRIVLVDPPLPDAPSTLQKRTERDL